MDTIVKMNQGHIGLKITLPVSKKYHIFLYCEEVQSDMGFADHVLQKLEKKGLKCCYAHRDFSPARTQVGNITQAIEESVKMVVIFSHAFFSSREGLYAAEMHLQTYIDQDRSLLIPIKIDECKIPPPFNAIMPTINIHKTEEEERWLHNLIRSIADKTDNYLNMKILASHRGVYCSKERKKLEMKVNFLLQLQREGLIMEERKLNTMISDIGNMYRNYCRAHKILFPVMAYVLLISIVGIIFLYTTRYFQEDIVRRWLPMIFVFSVAFLLSIIVSLILKRHFQDFYHKSYRSDLANINHNLFPDHIVVTIVGEEIKLVYYNYEPCMKYLRDTSMEYIQMVEHSTARKFQQLYKIVKAWFCCEHHHFKNEDILTQIVIEDSAMYACWYIRGKLTNRTEERHTVENQCLCQFIQNKWKKSVTHL